MITSTGKAAHLPRRQRGLSMVELMIAMLISVVLLGGVITLFISSKRGYAVQDAVGKLQENSRIATGWLDQGLRMTDYWGGTGSSVNLSISNTVSTMYSSTACTGLVADSSSGITSGIVGYAGGTFSSLPAAVQDCIGSSANYVPNTDVLLVRYADPEPNDLVKDSDLGSTSLKSNIENDTYADSLFVRYAPGFSSWIFQGSDYASTLPSSLAPSSTNPVYNAPYIVQLFFIAPCSNMAGSACASTDDGGSPQPALWRVALQGTTNCTPNCMVKQPLVPGVEMFRCKYGIDSTGSNNVDNFQTASGVTSWAQVYVVRYSIVVRADAPDKNQKDTNSYSLADGTSWPVPTTAISPGSVPDYWYIRKVFTETIQIRNRARY